MADWEISQLSTKASPAATTDYVPVLDTTDNSTPPAGAGGSDKRSTVQAVTQAGMGLTTLGDVSYGGASGVPTRLAGNTTSAKEFLTQTGTGSVSAAPAWGAIAAGDVPTLNQNTTGSAAKLTTARTIQTNLASASSASFDGTANITPGVTGTLPVGNGGTGQATQQAALDALAGAVTASQVLAGNGTHVTLRALAAADLPAATTSTQGAVILDGTAGDIAASPGTAAAGSVGKAADAGHVHPQPAMFAPTGLAGATAASRYVGATASGAPASGSFLKGDFIIDQTAAIWVCTTAGSPGTWTALSGGGGGVSSVAASDSSVTVAGSASVTVGSVPGQLAQRMLCV